MRTVLMVLLAVCMTCVGTSFVKAEQKSSQTADKAPILYVCNCGADCKCNTVSTQPGKCACGQPLAAMHVLKLEKDTALLCTCGESCTCKIDANDPSKCGCGKPVKKVSLKGLYVCNCGLGCPCNTVSDKPGKCTCGKELRKVS